MTITLDMSKAYNRMEWSFLESVMRSIGFRKFFIRLLMLCVTSISYFILDNGEPKGMIMFRGDPLSSFLFLLCSEGLNGLIFKATREGDIRGYSLCSRSPRLTHLLFVDDSLLFCKANQQDCRKILDILETCWNTEGDKSIQARRLFSLVKLLWRTAVIKEALGVQEIHQYEKYLGLPSLIGWNKKASFDYIKERVWRKLQGWGKNLVSQVAREVFIFFFFDGVFIKAMVQVIPFYTMSCFKLPMGLCIDF